jgi:hypothetical protein
LTDEQTVWMEQQDPNLEADTMLLRDRLSQAHADLTAGLEDLQATDQDLLARVDILIDAHRQLEMRVARSVMLLRPHLSPEQREHLVGLCGGGAGPWHGGSASGGHTDRDRPLHH